LFIAKNLPVHHEDGEESEKSFFASTGLEISEDVPLCRRKFKHNHSPQGNELRGMWSSKPPNQQMKAKGEKPQLNGGSLVLQDGVAHIRSCVKLYSLLNV
jgi:hypothetical protein